MSIIYILIPIAIILTIIAIYAFFWAVKTEQFNDLEKEGMSILFDEEKSKAKKSESESGQDQSLETQTHIKPSDDN